MKFRTEIFLEPNNFKIDHHNKITTLGSCFAQNIAEKFIFLKFRVLANPFGVLYNPVSILNSLTIIREQKRFDNSDLIFWQDEYHSFFHHSDYSHHKPEVILQNINSMMNNSEEFLKDNDILIITLGTSYIYRYLKNNQIVSNCHKIPAKEFSRERLSFNETVEIIKKIIDTAKYFNPKMKIIFTVSPIRHWKDGAVENQLSKATLLLAINSCLTDDVVYFPSYEILMDDLRDYRFYEKDLIHPNSVAIDYIWNKFSEFIFSEECKELVDKISDLNNAFTHRVRNFQSDNFKKFAEHSLKLIASIEKSYPYINFSEEKNYFRQNSGLIKGD